MTAPSMQIGVDFGGTKIEAAALDANGEILSRTRLPNPGSYDGALANVRAVIAQVEARTGRTGSIGIGTPGSISPVTGVMRNANSTYLNGRRFREDLQAVLGRHVRMANDANCFALSEAVDGAAAGARSVFGLIIGTGCGGGLVVDGRIVTGASGIAGEIGHIPLPWSTPEEHPGPECWCGLHGCVESWISGTGFARAFFEQTRRKLSAPEIIAASRAGDRAAAAAFAAYVDRLGRTLALIATLIDPDCIVLGGGLSNVEELYPALPTVIERYAFADHWRGRVVPAQWGDSSGVRGAARLWA